MIDYNITLYVFLFIVGTMFGSFFSMLSWRLANNLLAETEEELVPVWDFKTRSKCVKCDSVLPWYRLIPIFSWLYSKGKCHACGTSISVRYPLIEMTTGILTVLTYHYFGLTFEGLVSIVFVYFLIVLSIIDIEHKILPDVITYPFLWAGLLVNASTGMFANPVDAIYGAALGYMILWVVYYVFLFLTGRSGMGFGDFKLLAGLGAWFGYVSIYQIMIVSSLLFILFAFTYQMISRIHHKSDGNIYYPFGPFLAISGVITLFFGKII